MMRRKRRVRVRRRRRRSRGRRKRRNRFHSRWYDRWVKWLIGVGVGWNDWVGFDRIDGGHGNENGIRWGRWRSWRWIGCRWRVRISFALHEGELVWVAVDFVWVGVLVFLCFAGWAVGWIWIRKSSDWFFVREGTWRSTGNFANRNLPVPLSIPHNGKLARSAASAMSIVRARHHSRHSQQVTNHGDEWRSPCSSVLWHSAIPTRFVLCLHPKSNESVFSWQIRCPEPQS